GFEMTLTVTELVLATLAVLVLLALFTAQRYRVAGANEALVISGARGSKVRDEKGDLVTIHDQGVKVVVGAGTFTWPLINKDCRHPHDRGAHHRPRPVPAGGLGGRAWGPRGKRHPHRRADDHEHSRHEGLHRAARREEPRERAARRAHREGERVAGSGSEGERSP